MDQGKRYCQNRVKKRNKKLEALTEKQDFNSEMEGRQFKLNRFVRDVNTFVHSKEHSPVKKAKRGPLLNGIQTKYFKRDGTRREQTAKLDENLYKIIGLVNKENRKPCACLHNCNQSIPILANHQPTQRPLEVPKLRSASKSPGSSSSESFYTPILTKSGTVNENRNWLNRSDELDKKLYPEFTRIVSTSCAEAKSIHFEKKSYINALKKKLLCLYMEGTKDNSKDSKSVGTSPMDNSSQGKKPSLFTGTPSEPCDRQLDESHFSLRDFVPNPHKSTMQFLEENIGPSSNSQSSECRLPMPPPREQSRFQPASRPVRLYEPYSSAAPSPPLPSPPLMYKLGSVNQLGFFNPPNWFIPPVEEDSPEFKYFPRKIK